MSAVIWLIAALQAKHAVCDFCLQTNVMLADKGRYGGSGGLIHVGFHGLGTLLALLFFAPLGIVLALLIVLAEMVFHYHLDWGKERLNAVLGYTPSDLGFWVLIGGDQALHQWTYLVIAALAITAG